MGQGVDEAQRERELTKQALATHVDELETRIRAELDWKAKLRRNGPRYAVIGAAVIAVGVGLIVLRARFRKEKDESPDVTVNNLDDIAKQLKEIRKELDERRKDEGPLWQKVALRGATAAAAAAGTMAARQMMDRMGGEQEVSMPDDLDIYARRS